MNKNRALLLDRDGVINRDCTYIGSVERFEFMPGLFPFLRDMRNLGYRLAILTNQSGVARGLYSERDYARVTEHMLAGLRCEQIDIELVLACFEHPEGKVSARTRESFWRKPNPGMILEAVRRLDIDPARSVFLGDAQRDMEAAQAAGIGHCLWLNAAVSPPEGVTLVKDFTDALNHVLTDRSA